MSAQISINNFSNLVTSYKTASGTKKTEIKNQIFSLFDNANSVDFNSLNIQIKGNFYLYIGLQNNVLQAILVHSTTLPDIKQIDNYNPIVLDFKSNKFVANQSLPTKLTADNTQITYDEYIKRVNKWDSYKSTWVQNVLDKNTMISYFIIDQSNFKNNANNYCVFGIFENTDAPKGETFVIDFMTVNDGYMDRVRPVPPFRP